MTLYIGVDPGVNGGIAVVDETAAAVRVWKMPDTNRDMVVIFDEIKELGECRAMVEKIVAAPRSMVTEKCLRCGHTWSTSKARNSPKSMLVQGTNYGLILGGLIAANIPTEHVTASVWQRRFSLIFSRDQNLTITQKKNKHKQCAQYLFPEIKITHYVSDALLIADYCRQVNMKAPRVLEEMPSDATS